jgi:hypothetical protein
MSKKQPTLFEEGFLESYAGKIIESQRVAIIELIANSWDAGATEVRINWPLDEGDEFSIKDNGHGMTEGEFNSRFRKLSYNRTTNQGSTVTIPKENKSKIGKRTAFGRNGKGRLGGFTFGQPIIVATWKGGLANTFKVTRNEGNNLLSFQKIEDKIEKRGHGTVIKINKSVKPTLDEDQVREEIGMRFLTDPNFKILLNGALVSLNDIPEEHLDETDIYVHDVGKISLKVIDVQQTDKTTQQHGIAWHVNNRLVGECSWKGSGSEHLIDGRRIAAKRYIFIVTADCLADEVLPDWSSFYPKGDKWLKASEKVHDEIKNYLLELTREQREEVFEYVETSSKPQLKKMGIVSREKWEKFIKDVQRDCPSISSDDLAKLGALLANLENTESKFGLIQILASTEYDELDNLHEILSKWDVNFAKIVLDEIEYRVRLIEKLQAKVLSEKTDEVKDLQPLFHRGLWIFGPQYETIEFTSNQGMTKVIQDLFGLDGKGSRKRPDFAILKDSTVGLYSLPKYDDEGSEIGIDRLTIVELKKPGVPVGRDEVAQPFEYVKELFEKGLLKDGAKVTCFVLGSELDPYEADRTTKKGGDVVIQPLDYDVVMRRAKSRLLNLYSKIKDVGFLEDDRIREYLREKSEADLFD